MKRVILLLATAAIFAVPSSAQSDGARQFASSPADLIAGTEVGVSVSALDGNINASESVIIRGVNTLRGDSQPLWIVDGVILNNAMNQNLDAFYLYPEKSYTTPLNMMACIDPYKIESIEIIKDVAASSIYGSKGANGVIIIKTNKAARNAVAVDWTSNVGVGISPVKGSAFKTSASHNHSLHVSGTNSNTSYSVGAFFRDNNGTVRGSGNKFGGLCVQLESTGNSLVSIGMNTNLAIGKMNSAVGASYFGESSTMIAARTSEASVAGWLNGYDDSTLDFRTINSLWVNINLASSLKWKTTLGVDYEDAGRGIWYGNGTEFGNEVNRAASQIQGRMFSYNLETKLDFNQYFASVHRFNAWLGIGTMSSLNAFNTLCGTDFFTEELRAKGISLASSERPIHHFEHTHSQYYVTAGVSYDWASKVGVDANIRVDTTPRYDDWKPTVFGGVTGWIDVKKLLLENFTPLTSAKVKAGFGKAGNELYIPYRLLGNYTTGGYPVAEEGTQEYYEGMNFLRSQEINAGIEFCFIDRFSLSFTRYVKKTDDILSTYCFGKLDGKLWTRTNRMNMTTMSSKIGNAGWEITLGADILKRSRLYWNVNAGVAICQNAMIDLASNDIYGKKIGKGIYCNMNSVGYPVGSLVGVKIDSEGNPVDFTRDGRITEEDKQIIGNPFPKFHGFLNSTLKAGDFSLELVFTGATGFSLINLNTLLPLGTKIPAISENNLEDGSYLRLNRLSASYAIPLPVNWIIKGLKVTVSAMNLLTISKYSGWNPAVSCFGSSTLACGIDYGSFPLARTVAVGVSAKF